MLTTSEAKNQFRTRLGHLDENFFEMIPKSIAFKPMDNVKEFINRFVLSEEHVNIDELKGNIESLSELEHLLERNSRQLAALEDILSEFDAIEKKEREIAVNDILLMLADADALKERMAGTESEMRLKEQTILSNREELEHIAVTAGRLQEQII